MAQKIQEGSLNLSQIGELSRAIKESERATGQEILAAQKNDLVSAICGKTTQETQKELAAALDIEIKEFEKQRTQKDESVRLEITLSKDQFQKLSRCKDLVAHLLEQNHKDSSWASVIEVLANQYLSKKEVSSSSRRPTTKSEPADEPETNSIAASEMESVNKTLTPKVRRKILDRDRCCQFRDPLTGRECRSTFKLEIDHQTSQWAGGGHAEDNLQVFCKVHNQLKYRKESQLRFV